MKMHLGARNIPKWLVTFICIFIFSAKHVESKPNYLLSSGPKPKIGIAFGGGGAKAAAQIGVLKRLHQLGIKVDYVAGTSMGSVIAGLYAAGYTPSELEQLLMEDSGLWIYDGTRVGKIKINDGRKVTGVITTKYFQNHLEELLKKKGAHNYDDLKIPFRCVATNYNREKFEERVCSVGVIARDLASSTAYPIAFNPVQNKGEEYLDGGMMNNLPVDVVKAMGADIVIAIDLESGNKDDVWDWISFLADNLTLKLFSGTKWFACRPDKGKREENIAMADIYIHPALGDYDIKDYNSKKIDEMIEIGYNACLVDSIARKLEQLK